MNREKRRLKKLLLEILIVEFCITTVESENSLPETKKKVYPKEFYKEVNDIEKTDEVKINGSVS